MSDRDQLDEQIDYYRARAGEYDEWHLRQGRYDRGTQHNTQWFQELGVVSEALRRAHPFGSCLELACGTGQWTTQLAQGSTHLTAVDVSEETLEINRVKNPDASIEFQKADLFEWQPTRMYDFVFFGFWLSHIPRNRLDRFWSMLRDCLEPGGRVAFVDGLQVQETTARNHAPIDSSGITERKLNDGRIYRIVKVFHTPDDLMTDLDKRGWTGSVVTTGEFFYYGCVSPS